MQELRDGPSFEYGSRDLPDDLALIGLDQSEIGEIVFRSTTRDSLVEDDESR